MEPCVTVSQVSERFGFNIIAGHTGAENIIRDVYVGDLLSWVMGRAPEGGAWVTIQGHVNIVAVALLTGVSCIIIAEGADADADTITKANDEDIPILTTPLTSFRAAMLVAEALKASGQAGL